MITNICVELYLHYKQHLSLEIFFIPVWLKEKENHSEWLTTNKRKKKTKPTMKSNGNNTGFGVSRTVYKSWLC